MVTRNAKAWVGFVLACLTGAQAIWLNNIYLTFAASVVTAFGVWVVPNTVPPVKHHEQEHPFHDPV